MIIDSSELPDSGIGNVAAVVVGAGPCGIVTALELAKKGHRVVLVESGGLESSDESQRLGDAESLGTSGHAPMHFATRRQVGGASNIWGGRCVPYDPVDFDDRAYVRNAKWPIAYADLVPWFPAAAEWCKIGNAVFNSKDLPELSDGDLVPGFSSHDVAAQSLERWSLPTNFGRTYLKDLRRLRSITLVLNLTCVELKLSTDGTMTSVLCRGKSGREIDIRARWFVLAAGGLESTRLLLASNQSMPAGIGNQSGHLGRWYMSHTSGKIARIQFTSPPSSTSFAYERDAEGVYCRRRIAFSRDFLHSHALPNIVLWLVNPELPDPRHGSGVLSFVYLALRSPLGRRFASDAIRHAHIDSVDRHPLGPHFLNVIKDFPRTARFVASFGYRRFLVYRRIPGFFTPSRNNSYLLQYHGEHVPNWASRVDLGDQRDRFGLRRLRIDLRFGPQDADTVARAHEYLGGYLRLRKLGRLEMLVDDAAAAVNQHLGGGYHQIGTTRMAASPNDGVVDPHLRVHGVKNLSVVSSSVFVTSSQANSTFMTVVFALRLARDLHAALSA